MNRPNVKVLDVREAWEMEIGAIPKSVPLSPTMLDELMTAVPKETPILIYCHFGIRSFDAATFLMDRGFTEVFLLKGGIEAWSLEVDSNVPRYESAYC